ncbi:TetR/AcrR family transcriptional regulator [Novosphingobium flavum]|uniref:TetR family transcriptional regulator n=1 Tax=Novosphingobium aerophilum TaxID=2839843 RepID=UPI00163A1CA1|nr:TetR/AcrR family transcriptional regulator [Novosphingobium aerophilum]
MNGQAVAVPAGQDERADVIVRCADELLDEVGLEGLTIRAVLARTGLARRAFYDRFAGKDELVLAVFEKSLSEAARRFAAETEGLSSPLERLQRIVCGIVLGRAGHAADGHWELSRRSAALSREHLRLAETRPRQLQRAIEPLVALIARELANGMALGEVRRADARQLAVLVYNLVSTTVHAELLAEEADRQRREQLAAEIWEFSRRAIAG